MLHATPATSPSSARPSSSPIPQQAARYTLDGEPVALEELRANNDFDAEELGRIESLAPGQSIHIGGGAAPVFVLARVVDRPTFQDFSAWSNACRFALVERLLKALVDDVDPARCTPVIEVARMLLGKIRFAGYDQAVVDPCVLGVDVESMMHPVRWVLAVGILEFISESWDESEVELYDVELSFEEVLHQVAGVDAALLLKGGAR